MKIFSLCIAIIFSTSGCCIFPDCGRSDESYDENYHYVNNTKYTIGIEGNQYIIKPNETYEYNRTNLGGSYDNNQVSGFSSYSEVTVYTRDDEKLCYEHTEYTNSEGRRVDGMFDDPTRYTEGKEIETSERGNPVYLRTFTFTQADIDKATPCDKEYTITYKYINDTKYDINFRNYFNLKPNSSHEITGKIIGYTFDPKKQPPRNIATKDFRFKFHLTFPEIIYTYQNEKLCYSYNRKLIENRPWNIITQTSHYKIMELSKDENGYPKYLMTFIFTQSDVDLAESCE